MKWVRIKGSKKSHAVRPGEDRTVCDRAIRDAVAIVAPSPDDDRCGNCDLGLRGGFKKQGRPREPSRPKDPTAYKSRHGGSGD